MAVIKYERGADGVVRESVSNDGGKTFTQTNANSSNGYSGGYSSSKNNTSSNKNTGNSGGTNYSGYTQDQYNNQSAYLQGLIAQGGGNAEWAKSELNNLNSQYGGNNNSGNNGYWHENPDGSGTQYNNVDTGKWDTSGQKWTNVGGTQGVNYAISGDNGTIIATDSNGVQTRFLPTSQDYNSFYQNMMSDIKAAGNSYTPHYTFGVDRDLDGQQEYYDRSAYEWGNTDLQYALQQARKENPNLSVDDYVMSLYNRVGTQRQNGTMVSLQDVANELTRLGLSDYLPGKAIYTAGGKLLPGNDLVSFKDDNGMTTNSADSRWASYGGQDYLLSGDSANLASFVNALNGNYSNLDYIFGGANMANNPYAQQDPAFLAQFNNDLANLYAQAGMTGNNSSITGNQNVDNVINYVNSMNNFNQAMGNGSGDLWSEIKAMLQGGLESQQAFLASQRTQAEQNAEELARQAYVNNKMQGDSLKEALSASGLGTSGAMQSAQLGVQSNYNNSLGDIRRNLNTMLSGLSEQELKALADYTNNMTDYAYRIKNDEQDRAYQNAQLYMQQLEMQQNQQQQEWEKAYKQQLLELDRQKYADSQAKERDETDYGKKLDSADYYSQIYNADKMSTAEYQRLLRELGIFA